MKPIPAIVLAIIAGSFFKSLRASEASRPLSTLHLKVINTGVQPTGVLIVDFRDPACYRNVANVPYPPRTDGKKAFYIDCDTCFTIKQEMPWRQDIRIGIGDRIDTHHVVLLSGPGDSASLTLDFGKICKNDETGFAFNGKQGPLNAQINACEKYLSQLSDAIRFPGDSSAYRLFPEKIAQMQDSFARYIVRAKISKTAKEWAQRSIAARVYLLFRETLGPYEIDFPRLPQITPDDPQYLFFSGFQTFLTDYAQRNFNLFSDNRKNSPASAWERIAAFIDTQPASACRDFMAFQLVARILRDGDKPDVPHPAPACYFASSYFSDRAAQAISQQTDIRFQETPLKEICYFNKRRDTIDTVSGEDIFSLLRNRYPGKVIYIDIWGTWCSPCIAQMPDLAELEKRYDGKEVVFVTLAIWSPREKWAEMVGSGRIPGESFLLDFASATVFRTVCDFYSFPSHLLMDRNGRITARNVPVGFSGTGAAIGRLLDDE